MPVGDGGGARLRDSPVYDWNFADVWESVADALPDTVALVQGDRRLTWHELDDRAAAPRRRARAPPGSGPGSKVASYLYNSNEYIEGVFATFKLRGVPVNVNYRYLEDELAYLIDNSDAEALLFHGELGDRVAKVRDRAPRVKLWIQVDDGAPAPRLRGRATRSSSPRTIRWSASSDRATTSTSSTPAAPPACRRA